MIKQIEVTQMDRDIVAAFLEEWEPGPEMTVATMTALLLLVLSQMRSAPSTPLKS